MLFISLVSGEDLGQAAILEDLRRLEHGSRQRLHFVVQAVTRKGQHKDCILHRPH